MTIAKRGIQKLRRDGLIEFFRTLAILTWKSIRALPYEFLIHRMDFLDLGDLRAASGTAIDYTETETVRIEQITPDIPHEIERYLGVYDAEIQSVFTLEDVCVTRCGVFTTANNEIVRGVSYTTASDFAFRRNLMQSVTTIRAWLNGAIAPTSVFPRCHEASVGLAFPLLRPGGSYYHWLIEYLPKIRGLRAFEDETGNSPTVLIEQDPPSWVLESLALLGISDDQLLEMESPALRVDTAVLSTHRIRMGASYNPSTRDLRWLRDAMVSAVGNSRGELPDRVFISRRDATSRRVSNMEEVRPLLVDHGFEILELSALSVSEQTQVFSNAEIVIGAHGGGLANLVFGDCPRVLELQPVRRIREFYYCMSSQLGYEYSYLICEQTSNGDIVVPVEELSGWLADLDDAT